MADYAMSMTVDGDYATTVQRTRAALAEQGFGVLTEIDVAATMKTKLDLDLPPYLILGACNPPLAHRAITAEPSIGLLLPCNVVIRFLDDDRTLVEALDPWVMSQVADDPRLAGIAEEARAKLTVALDSLVHMTKSA